MVFAGSIEALAAGGAEQTILVVEDGGKMDCLVADWQYWSLCGGLKHGQGTPFGLYKSV